MDQQDPDYKDYQDYLEYQKHLAAPSQPQQDQPEEPGLGSSSIAPGAGSLVRAAMSAAGGDVDAAGRSAINSATLGNAPRIVGALKNAAGDDYLSARDQVYRQLAQDSKDNPSSSTIGKGVGLAMAGGAMPGSPVVAGAATGALQNPGDVAGQESGLQLGDRAANAGIGALIGKAVPMVIGGVGKAGDYLMQKAVDARKYIPGMGTTLADLGVWGTKGGMADQVSEELANQENALRSGVSKLEGSISPDEPINAIKALGDRYSPGIGEAGPLPTPSESAPFIQKAANRAQEAADRGALSPSDALSMSRAIAKPAYNNLGNPLDAFSHKMSQAEAGSLKDALKNMADEQGVPEVRDSLKNEAALITAKRGLVKPDNIGGGLAGANGLKLAELGMGGHIAGIPGALAAVASGTSLAKSLAAQGLVKGSQTATQASPTLLQALMANRQGDLVEQNK